MEAKLKAKSVIEVKPLQQVMQYENIDVVERFRESWNLSMEQSLEVFEELKKWLWLCANNVERQAEGQDIPNLAVTYSMTLLDEMWHAFILFTKEYSAFCKENFGFYIHHGPTTSSEKDKIKGLLEDDAEGYLEEMEKTLTKQYEYIYEQLGEETLKKWYSDWTDKYTPEVLNELYSKQW